jgi:hypothetical protein
LEVWKTPTAVRDSETDTREWAEPTSLLWASTSLEDQNPASLLEALGISLLEALGISLTNSAVP